MCSIAGVAESTYKMCYRGEVPTLPYIKYKTLPCNAVCPPGSFIRQKRDGIKEHSFDLKRANVPVPHPPQLPPPVKPRPTSGVKFPSATSDQSKKIFCTQFGPMDMETIEKLSYKYRYTTFAQKAAEECALPIKRPKAPKTILEPKADMIRLYGQRYERSKEDWQEAVLLDRLQSRYPTDRRPTSPCKDKLLRRSQRDNSLTLDKDRLNEIRQLIQTDGLAGVFTRKCPGYAGYSPLCPPETRLNDKKNPPEMETLMSSSYRKFSDELYRKQSFARQGPFSQTVTLTYPFNPFNKVGEEIINSVEKNGITSTTGTFVGLIA